MKRLWIGIGIMAVVIGLLIWGNVTIVNACEEMSREINQITEQIEQCGDSATVQETAGRLKKSWERYHTPLSVVKNHEELHDLLLNINLIEKYTQEWDEEALREACDASLVRLEHIKDGEKISLGNVF